MTEDVLRAASAAKPREGLFAALADADWTQLAGAGRTGRFTDRQLIFQKGDPADYMALVLRGCVRISATNRDGREVLLNLIGPGELMGEIAVLDGGLRSADATAAAECDMLMIPRAAVLRFLEDRPAVARAVIATLCERLRRSTTQAEALALFDLPGRLAQLLLQLARDRGTGTGGGTDGGPIRIARPPNQSDIARLIGASRERVNRQMRLWTDGGLIEARRGGLWLHDIDALKDLSA